MRFNFCKIIEALLNGDVDAEVEVDNDTITLYGSPQDLFKIKKYSILPLTEF